MAETKEAVVQKVAGGLKPGNRVKIRSGEYNGVDLEGLHAHVIREEEVCFNSESGKTEPMVLVEAPLSTGEMSLPLHVPRHRLKGPKDQHAVLKFVGKCVSFIRNGKYYRTGAKIRPVCAEDAKA